MSTIEAPEDSGATSLVVIERTTALDVFKEPARIEALVAQVRQLATAEPLDASTAVGRAAIKTLAVKIQRSKTYLDGIGKELVDDLKELPKRIDASRKLARDQLDALREEVRRPLTEWEAEQERVKREKEAAERAEQERKEAVQRAITSFVQAPLDAIGKKHADIAAMLEGYNETILSADFFGDRIQEANDALAAAVEKLRHMAEQAEAIEQQEQIERDRRVAEEAARREREAGEQRILQERLATERAERERAAAEQRARDAEAAAARAAEQAAQREEQARLQAAEQERQRIAREAEAQRLADEERAANVAHRKAINNQAVSSLMTHAELTLPQARAVVMVMAQGKISNCSINY